MLKASPIKGYILLEVLVTLSILSLTVWTYMTGIVACVKQNQAKIQEVALERVFYTEMKKVTHYQGPLVYTTPTGYQLSFAKEDGLIIRGEIRYGTYQTSCYRQ